MNRNGFRSSNPSCSIDSTGKQKKEVHFIIGKSISIRTSVSLMTNCLVQLVLFVDVTLDQALDHSSTDQVPGCEMDRVKSGMVLKYGVYKDTGS